MVLLNARVPEPLLDFGHVGLMVECIGGRHRA
jgi:hypothetical protein